MYKTFWILSLAILSHGFVLPGRHHIQIPSGQTSRIQQHRSAVARPIEMEKSMPARWKFWKRLPNRFSSVSTRITRKMKKMTHNNQWLPVMASFLLASLFFPRAAMASGGMGGGMKTPVAPMERYVDTVVIFLQYPGVSLTLTYFDVVIKSFPFSWCGWLCL